MNNKVSCVIVDDEPGNVITIEEILKSYCPEIEILGSAPNPIVAYDIITRLNPSLVFLDIEMPYGNAFTLLDKLSPITFEVIFITAFNEYAIKAFKYSALDYLLKPVNINDLRSAVKKAVTRLEEKNMNTRIASLLSNMKVENKQAPKIGLPTSDGFRFEDVNNIIFLEAQGSYTAVFIKGNIKEMVSKNLKEFEEILPSGFCRVHHSYIININFVKKYYKGRGGYVEMEDGTAIEISVRKKDDFLNKFLH